MGIRMGLFKTRHGWVRLVSAVTGRAWRGIIFRQSYKQLDDIIAKTKKWFWRIFPEAKYNASDHRWSFPDNEELLLRYMDNPDDYWNYHGHEYPWIGWEELTNWATPDCYESMKSCCRSSDPGLPRKYRATANPYGAGHNWVKAMFIDPAPAGVPIHDKTGRKRVRIHGHIRENKVLLENDPEYLKNIESITDENKRKAWLDGDWDIVAGGMFDDVWKKQIHIVQPFQIPRVWFVDRSFDWGSSRPFSVGWWAESNGSQIELADGSLKTFPRGTLFRIHEYYGWNGRPNEGCRKTAKEIARAIKGIQGGFRKSDHLKQIKRVLPGPADTSIFDTENDVCIASDMEDEGVMWLRADKRPGSRINGWQLLRERLKAGRQFPMEDPGLFVFDTCRHFIRTVPVLPRGESKPEDVDTKAEDHIGDETRYRLLKTKNK